MAKMPPIHPGEILLEEFLKPLSITAYRLARDIGVTPRRIGEIIHGKRAITANSALRLRKYFGMSAQFWLHLQMKYDLEIEELHLKKTLASKVKVYDEAKKSTRRKRVGGFVP